MTLGLTEPVTAADIAPLARPASNAPAPPRTFGWLARLLQRWLGVADQRQDFDRLATTLASNDQETAGAIAGARRDLEETAKVMQRFANQLGETSNLANRSADRLGWHESHVAVLMRSRKSYQAAVTRETRRREKLIAANPAWSEAMRAHVQRTGDLPPAVDPMVPRNARDAMRLVTSDPDSP